MRRRRAWRAELAGAPPRSVPAGAELLVAYEFCSRRSRKYLVAPPPPLSTPLEWGQHLDAAEARLLRAQRARAEQRAQVASAEASAAAAADAARARLVARSRARLVRQNAAAAASKRCAVAEHAARMRVAKLAKR